MTMDDEVLTMAQLIHNVARAIAREDGWNERRVLGSRYQRRARAAVKEITLAYVAGDIDVKRQLEERMCCCEPFWTDRGKHNMAHACYHVGNVLDAFAAIMDEPDESEQR